jgi:hypothetical protein
VSDQPSRDAFIIGMLRERMETVRALLRAGDSAGALAIADEALDQTATVMIRHLEHILEQYGIPAKGPVFRRDGEYDQAEVHDPRGFPDGWAPGEGQGGHSPL